jgi:saccharopine dehydrogenase-like NADP-dependent oxidoreductase
MTDAARTWQDHGLGAVAWQTGFNPVIAMELLSSGVWKGSGVLGPEPFDPDPYLALLDRSGIHHDMVEMEPGAHTPT